LIYNQLKTKQTKLATNYLQQLKTQL